MSLKRKEIRHHTVALLKGKTDAGDRVKPSKVTVHDDTKNLPAIGVYQVGEPAEEYGQAPRELKKLLQLTIEVVVAGNTEDEASDRLDEICEQVEGLLIEERYFIASEDKWVAEKVILTNTEFDWEEEGTRPILSARMVYQMEYLDLVPRDRKGQDIGTLEGADVDWKAHPSNPDADADPTAEDTIDVETE